MKTIKANTKEGKKYFSMYYNSNAHDLHDCYKTPSTNKTRVDYFCRLQMSKENGICYRIISFNTFHFSVAWRTAEGLRIETPTRSILVLE